MFGVTLILFWSALTFHQVLRMLCSFVQGFERSNMLQFCSECFRCFGCSESSGLNALLWTEISATKLCIGGCICSGTLTLLCPALEALSALFWNSGSDLFWVQEFNFLEALESLLYSHSISRISRSHHPRMVTENMGERQMGFREK